MSTTTLWTTLTAAGFLTLALSVPGSAAASLGGEADYLYDLNNSGIGGPTDQLLALGALACTGKQNSVDKEASVTQIRGNSSLEPADAGFLYDSASMFLCP
ncbi:hypothetical protein BH10ACT9_BH10ACT9_07970 [soil metagenome]